MQKLIFIVDDNDTNLTVAADALEDFYRVLTMPSANKMFKLLEKMKPDLILLDVEMPEMTGFEAIVLLKQDDRWKDIPVVFVTATQEGAQLEKAKELGGAEVVSKPFTVVELKNAVGKYLQ